MSELIFMRHGNHISDSDLIRHDADRVARELMRIISRRFQGLIISHYYDIMQGLCQVKIVF